MSVQLHGEPYRVEFSRYLAAYDLTYRYHYEMQDDWLAFVNGPDFEQITGFSRADVEKYVQPMSFEFMESVMLCIADDEYWRKRAGDVADQSFVEHWIVEWRARLGRYIPEIDGMRRPVVWRDNWRDVRDVVVAINRKVYSIVSHGPPYTADETAHEGLLALARRLIVERGLRPYDYSESRHFDYFIADQISRIARKTWKEYIVEHSGQPFQLPRMN